MWPSALDYSFSPSGYNTSSNNNTSNSFFGNSLSDNEIKMNDANFSQFHQQLAMSLTGNFPFMASGIPSSPNSTETAQIKQGSVFESSKSGNNMMFARRKKLSVPVPTEKKTQAYYERRKKNNQSAQKSRNERRRREQENVFRIGQLEQENGVLRTMVQQLQSRVNFQEIQLQSLQPQSRTVHGTTSTTNGMERRNTTNNCSSGTQVPFANQMNMLMNSY